MEDTMTKRTHATRTAILITLGTVLAGLQLNGQSLPNLYPFPNSSGILQTYNAGGGPIDLTGPFFQSLGTNGRSCNTCHRAAQGWSLSPDEIKTRFDSTQGTDPLFRTNDGSNCDHNIDTSTVGARRKAYSLLIDRGVLRITLAVPPDAEFQVVSVANPYGCADTANVAVYRRPLPSTNLRFHSVLMWDGRESAVQTGTQKITFATNPTDLVADLAHQSLDATSGHAQGAVLLTAQQQQAIVDFEMALSTAQAYDYRAGALNSNGANGGPSMIDAFTRGAFFVGINDPLGGNPHGTQFTPVIFSLFDAWASPAWQNNSESAQRRASILRGQTLFNSKPIQITGVAGLNDDLQLTTIPGTCGTCHDSPNIGNHSVAAPLNIGVADLTSSLDLSYLPVLTVRNKTTGEIKTTTDPGRALISGLWKDMGRMKGPILRGLASRAPYFHNGSASSLADVIDFYENRFHIGLTRQDKEDLIAFLSSL
jgi:cytochrome c peroxidase